MEGVHGGIGCGLRPAEALPYLAGRAEEVPGTPPGPWRELGEPSVPRVQSWVGHFRRAWWLDGGWDKATHESPFPCSRTGPDVQGTQQGLSI